MEYSHSQKGHHPKKVRISTGCLSAVNHQFAVNHWQVLQSLCIKVVPKQGMVTMIQIQWEKNLWFQRDISIPAEDTLSGWVADLPDGPHGWGSVVAV